MELKFRHFLVGLLILFGMGYCARTLDWNKYEAEMTSTAAEAELDVAVETATPSEFCDSRLDEIEEEVGRLFELDDKKVEVDLPANTDNPRVTLQWLLTKEMRTSRVRILVWKNKNNFDEYNIKFDRRNEGILSIGQESFDLQSIHQFEYGGRILIWIECNPYVLYYIK